MPILSVDHVQLAIPVGGEERAREFYTGILGLSEVEKPPAMAGRNSIWFAAGAANVHLGRKRQSAHILKDLRKRKADWLPTAARSTSKAIAAEWKEYAAS